jgi:hypothetical protein
MSNSIQCQRCSKQIPPHARRCPHCGDTDPTHSTFGQVCIGIVTALIVGLGVLCYLCMMVNQGCCPFVRP